MTGQFDHVDTKENKYAHMQKAATRVHDFIAETIEQCSQLTITSIAIFRKQTLDTHCSASEKRHSSREYAASIVKGKNLY